MLALYPASFQNVSLITAEKTIPAFLYWTFDNIMINYVIRIVQNKKLHDGIANALYQYRFKKKIKWRQIRYLVSQIFHLTEFYYFNKNIRRTSNSFSYSHIGKNNFLSLNTHRYVKYSSTYFFNYFFSFTKNTVSSRDPRTRHIFILSLIPLTKTLCTTWYPNKSSSLVKVLQERLRIIAIYWTTCSTWAKTQAFAPHA